MQQNIRQLKRVPNFSNHWHYLKPRALFLRASAALAFAAAALLAPGGILLTSAVALGFYFLIDGGSAIAASMPKGVRSQRGRGWFIGTGAISALFGILTLVNQASGVFTLGFLLGGWAFAGGALAVAGSRELRKTCLVRDSARQLLGVLGVASMVMGALIFWQPGIGLEAFLTLVACQGLIVSVISATLGLEMRRHTPEARAVREVPVEPMRQAA